MSDDYELDLLHLHLRGSREDNEVWIELLYSDSNDQECDFISCWDDDWLLEELALAVPTDRVKIYHQRRSEGQSEASLLDRLCDELLELCLPVLIHGGISVKRGVPPFDLNNLPEPDEDLVWLLVDHAGQLVGLYSTIRAPLIASVISGQSQEAPGEVKVYQVSYLDQDS